MYFLDGWDLTPSDASVGLSGAGGAVAIPNGDKTSHDALNDAAVIVAEDLRGHDRSFQPPKGEEVLPCLLHDFWCQRALLSPLDVDTEELEALDPLHCGPVAGGVHPPPRSVL